MEDIVKRLRADFPDSQIFSEPGYVADTYEDERREAAGEIERLRKALKVCLDAIESGRSEPLYIARDHARNTLADLSEKRDEGMGNER